MERVVSTSIFTHPKDQWIDLLRQNTWETLYEKDFPYLMSSGSEENLKFFMDIFTKNQLPPRDGNLAQTITTDMFEHNWTPETLHDFLIYLRTQQSLLPQLYRAILSSGGSQLKIPSNSPLFYYAVVEDSDLLAQLLIHSEERTHANLIAHLIAEIAPSYIKDFDGKEFHFIKANSFKDKMFCMTTAQHFPEYCDQTVKHICNQIRFRLDMSLTLQQRVNEFAGNLWAYCVCGKKRRTISEDIYQAQIENLEEFAKNHQDSLSVENWQHLVKLFNQINTKHACDTSETPILNMYALKGRLEEVSQQAYDQNIVEQSHTPTKRKM